MCKKTYSTGYSQAVTHPSTNPAQCCLTSVIRREPVHSAWYGRRTLQCTNTGRLYYTNSHDMKLQQMAECRNNCHNDTGNIDTTNGTSCLLTKHIQHCTVSHPSTKPAFSTVCEQLNMTHMVGKVQTNNGMLLQVYSLVSRCLVQHFTVRLIVSVLHHQTTPKDLQLVQLEQCLRAFRGT